MNAANSPTAGTGKGIGFLFPVAKCILRVLRHLTIGFYLPDKSTCIDAYVLSCIILLVGGGLMLTLHPWVLPIVTFIAAYRVFDLAVTHMSILVTGGWRGEKTFASYGRALLLAMVNYLELLFSSAIMLFALDKWLPTAFNKRFDGLGDALYVAAITLTTTGYGDYRPMLPCAKYIVTVLLLFSVLILTQIIARFASLPEHYPEEYHD